MIADKRLNILFVIHSPRSQYTAVYNCYQQLAQFLEGEGHCATIVAPEDFPRMYRRHARWFPLIYPLWIAVWLAVKGNKYELAVFHSYAGWLVQLMRRCVPAYRGMRIVTAFHGLEPIYYRKLYDESKQIDQPLRFRFRMLHGILMPWLIRLGCRRSDQIVCLNSEEIRYLEKHKWAKRSAISLVANGVPHEFFTDRVHAPKVRRLLFVGQWQAMKGVHDLARFFTLLAQELPEVELRCVGTLKPADRVLEDFPAEIRNRVSVLPQIRRTQLVAEYQSADIFVFPTLSEGFSNALLEAMAAGLPIVTTPVGAATDLLLSEMNAIVVRVRDPHTLLSSVRRLIDDRTLRERLGRQAQATAREYDIHSVHKRFASLLEETMRRNDWKAGTLPSPQPCNL